MLCCFYLVWSGLIFRVLLWMACSTSFTHVDWNLWRGGDALSLSAGSLFPLAEALTCSRSRGHGWRHPSCPTACPAQLSSIRRLFQYFLFSPALWSPPCIRGPAPCRMHLLRALSPAGQLLRPFLSTAHPCVDVDPSDVPMLSILAFYIFSFDSSPLPGVDAFVRC